MELTTQVLDSIESIHKRWSETSNIATELDEQTLIKIGQKVVDEYDLDDRSLDDWRDQNEEVMNLARQLKENRSWAGEPIADIKYPVISTAAIQFQARAFPNIVKGKRVVKASIVGPDPAGQKASRGDRVAQAMSYQTLNRNTEWVTDMDKLLMSLPLYGCAFKKTYWCAAENSPKSEFISADDLVVNYAAKSFEPRASHKIWLYPNEIRERQMDGRFLNVKLPEGSDEEAKDGHQGDDDAPKLFIEQHKWFDLDDDGFPEPWIVTVHHDTGKVMNIYPRFYKENIKRDEDGNVTYIKPNQYFTKYSFFPSFDGCFYDMGFGMLLAPINNTINSMINQILDAGTLANRQAGFIGAGLKMGKSGVLKFAPGEWKVVPAFGRSLRDEIFPLPIKEPSAVLYQLLGLMETAANKLASMADVMTGEAPKGDQPATTTLALIEQGLKVYTAVYKRIHTGLSAEFAKMYELNRVHLDDEEYAEIVDNPEAFVKMDFNNRDFDIIPVSDEADVADAQKMIRSQAVIELAGKGLINQQEATRRYLMAIGEPDIERLMQMPEPQPNPEIVLKEKELAIKEREVRVKELEFMGDSQMRQFEMLKLYTEAVKKLAEAEATEQGMQIDYYKSQADVIKSLVDAQMRAVEGVNGVYQGAVRSVEGTSDDQGGVAGATPTEEVIAAGLATGGLPGPGILGENGAELPEGVYRDGQP